MAMVIVRGRRGGKTHGLIELWRGQPHGYLLVPHAQRKFDIIREYGIADADLQRRILIVSTLNDAPEHLQRLRGLSPRDNIRLYIDDLDNYLERLLGYQVGVVTLTGHAL